MPAKNKNSVHTPLHLLQLLSGSLLEHLEQACVQALTNAEKMLAKLEKQRGKAQEKLHEAHARLQGATIAGKAKAQQKAKAVIDELEKLLEQLKSRQAETRGYIAQLKRDAQDSLKLAQGVGKVREATRKLIESRAAAKSAIKAAATVTRKPVAKSAAKPVSKAAANPAAKPATRKAAASTKATAVKPVTKPAAAKPVVKKASTPAKPAAAKVPSVPVADNDTPSGA